MSAQLRIKLLGAVWELATHLHSNYKHHPGLLEGNEKRLLKTPKANMTNSFHPAPPQSQPLDTHTHTSAPREGRRNHLLSRHVQFITSHSEVCIHQLFASGAELRCAYYLKESQECVIAVVMAAQHKHDDDNIINGPRAF